MPVHKVFVYGTLRDPTVEASHKLTGFLMYSNGRFPFIVPGDANAVVYGNLLKADDNQLGELDRYEGVAHGLYTREVAEVENIKTGKKTKAFVYVAGTAAPKLITSGNWFDQ